MAWNVTVKPEHQRQHQTKHILCCWICYILQHVWSSNCKWFRMFPCHSLARYTHKSYWFEQWQMTPLLIIIRGFFSNIPIIWKLVWLLYWRCSTYSSLAPFYSASKIHGKCHKTYLSWVILVFGRHATLYLWSKPKLCPSLFLIVITFRYHIFRNTLI